ncbi:MAG: nicotinate phosphoribosyltransferase [Vulcanimicrobiota bacterium]
MNLSLLTDLYQLTMVCGYHAHGKLAQESCFELYFRKLPFAGGYCLSCGLEPALEWLEGLRFEAEQLDYLRNLNLFPEDFLDWLSQLRFRGDVWAIPEGELVFPGEPLLRVQAPLPQAQLVESALLNIVNYHTLVATKASRIRQAAEGGLVLEFGLRRAQGINGALAATRAAIVGGCQATSNVLAGQLFQVPVKGTHAHSWIMSFDTELEAFRAYAHTYPDSCTLLVDTYDTLQSGVPNAIRVGQELAEKGHVLAGIRLDSGDLAQLSIESRKMLDQAGLTQTRILASNDLDEYAIAELKSRGARIDIWGVGTNLVTCKDEPALGGVYKLVAASDHQGELRPRIKVSSNPGKSTVPGIKQLYRAYSGELVVGDVLCLAHEEPSLQNGQIGSTQPLTGERKTLNYDRLEPVLVPVMEKGRRLRPAPDLQNCAKRSEKSLQSLAPEFRRIQLPETYWVGLSDELLSLRKKLLLEALR